MLSKVYIFLVDRSPNVEFLLFSHIPPYLPYDPEPGSFKKATVTYLLNRLLLSLLAYRHPQDHLQISKILWLLSCCSRAINAESPLYWAL